MKLYDAMTPSSLRVNVFLAEKGVDLPREKIDVLNGATRTDEFLKINPLGEVPVLELDDGSVLTESVAICRYLEALHPEPNLFGRDAAEQARVEMWNRRIELHLLGSIADAARHRIPFFADKIEQVPAYADTQARRFAKVWSLLDQDLADGRAFIAGDRFTIADITAIAALFVSNITQTPPPRDTEHACAWETRLRSRNSFAGLLPQAA